MTIRNAGTAALLLSLILIWPHHDVNAAERRSQIAVPADAKVQVNGNVAHIEGRAEVSGTFECGCSDSKGGGCVLTQQSQSMYCSSSTSGGCKTGCVFITTTGATGPARASGSVRGTTARER